jgi:hypothetical protein
MGSPPAHWERCSYGECAAAGGWKGTRGICSVCQAWGGGGGHAGAPTTSLSTHMGMLSVIKQSCVLQPCMAAERGGPGSAVCARQVPAWLQPAATNSNCNGIGHAHLLLLLLFLHHEHTAPTAAQLTE